MSNLLKEAIADAKTVRETAIANAKMALEEAFTPHLKSMLSAKLAEDEVEEGLEDEITAEEMDDEEDEDMDEMRNKREDDDEEMEEGEHDEDEEVDEMRGEDPEREEDDEDVDEGIIEINGVKYAPVVEGEHEDDEDPEEGKMRREDDDEVDEDIDNLDLESVIKELETEIAEAEESDEDSVNEGEDEDEKDEVDEEIVVEEDEEDLEEQSKSSGIGAGDNKVTQASAGDEEDPGKGKIKESVEAMQEELNEYKEAVTFLREKLHEVNILNAKLLYTNRLFKEFVLSNGQKMKIVETFDRAQPTREIKLVYSTLAESFKNGDVKKSRVQESASQKTGTTKPTQKIITEESQVADRFKKLAGIL